MNQQLLHDEWEENIMDRATGELNDKESAQFNEHLASCASCAQEVRDYEFLSRRLRAVEQEIVVPALSPALLALQQEIVQHRIQEEAHQIAEQTFARETKMHAIEWLPDDELMARVQAGDGDAFAALYDRHADSLGRYLLQFTHDQANVDDLVQATFTRCFQYLRKERKPFQFKPWLYTIARHVSLDYAGRKKKERVSVALLDEELQTDLEAGEMDEGTFAPPVMPSDQPYLSGSSTDERAIVKEMIGAKDSEHWKACSNFVRHHVHAKARGIPIDIYDDIAQEVLYKIRRGLPSFRFTSTLRVWVSIIIKRTIIDMRRKLPSEVSNKISFIEGSSESVQDDKEKSAEDIFMMNDEIRSGWEACLRYAKTHGNPSRNQLIIRKVIYEGETFAEAAKAAGCSEAIAGYVVREAQNYARKLREYSW